MCSFCHMQIMGRKVVPNSSASYQWYQSYKSVFRKRDNQMTLISQEFQSTHHGQHICRNFYRLAFYIHNSLCNPCNHGHRGLSAHNQCPGLSLARPFMACCKIVAVLQFFRGLSLIARNFISSPAL